MASDLVRAIGENSADSGGKAVISESYATGRVVNNATRVRIGGFVGENSGLGEAEIIKSFYDKNMTGQSEAIGLGTGDAVGLETHEMTGEAAQINMIGFDFVTTWKTTDFYPELVDIRDTSTTKCINRAVAGSDAKMRLTEIQTAIDWWAEGMAVPDTGGKTINLSKIQSLIDAWAEGSTVVC